jgi:N6-L-threonylcarbamoyladenine synthase
LDDAAGEAFDKVARLLDLGYPGGPVIAKAAESGRSVGSPTPHSTVRSRTSFNLPRPMISSKDYNFSFSGLKTAVLYKLKELEQKMKISSHDRGYLVSAMAKEFQQAVIDVLIKKTIRAAKEYKAKTIILGGGVAANKELRKQLSEAVGKLNFENRLSLPSLRSAAQPRLRFSKFVSLLIPEMEFTGDNAAMIALAAYFRWQNWQKNKKPCRGRALRADGNLKLV